MYLYEIHQVNLHHLWDYLHIFMHTEEILSSLKKRLWLLNFEDKRLEISLLTLKISLLLMKKLKTASCAGSPGCPTWFNTMCLKSIVIDVKSCPFITQGKIITMPRFWFAFQMSLTYQMRAGGWRWSKWKNTLGRWTSFCALCVLHQLLTQP